MASKTCTRQSKEQYINNLVKATRLPKAEVQLLMTRYDRLCKKEGGKLHRIEFRDELNRSFNISDDILMDRVFKAFDKKSCGTLRQEDYVIGIGKFLNGSMDEQIHMAFDVYDLNNDGYISREEMFQLLKFSLVKAQPEEDPDELVKELVDIAMKKLDIDHDGRVSLQDFRTAVAEEKLMLESLGKCLPDEKSKVSFQENNHLCGASNSGADISISQQKEKQIKMRAKSGQKAA